MDLLLLDSFVRALFCLAVLWMLFDAVRRGRGWVRWQVRLYFLGFVAVSAVRNVATNGATRAAGG